MKKKTKVFFLFFLLSITPFIRGCSETWGFPFPAVGGILKTSVISEVINSLIGYLKSYKTFVFLLVNLLIAYLLARSVLRNEKYQRWTSSFLTSLSIHLSTIWLMVFIGLADFQQPLLKKASEFYALCYSGYFFDIPIRLANRITNTLDVRHMPQMVILFKKTMDYLDITGRDILSRAYFILAVTLISVVIYLVKFTKRSLAEQKK